MGDTSLLDDLQRARDVARAERRRRQKTERAFWAMLNMAEHMVRTVEWRFYAFKSSTLARLREAQDISAATAHALRAIGAPGESGYMRVRERIMSLSSVADATKAHAEELSAVQRRYALYRWEDRNLPPTVETMVRVINERDEARGDLANALHYGLRECERLREQNARLMSALHASSNGVCVETQTDGEP